jgi:hypothetical protein
MIKKRNFLLGLGLGSPLAAGFWVDYASALIHSRVSVFYALQAKKGLKTNHICDVCHLELWQLKASSNGAYIISCLVLIIV